MMRFGAAALLLVAIESLCASDAMAQAGDTRSMQVTANIRGNCKFDATPNINFGDLDPSLATDKQQTVDITFKCTKGVTYTLTLGDGLNFDSGRNRMSGAVGTDFIPYDITPKTLNGAGKGFGVTDTIQVTGTIRGPDYQNVSQGAYADTVTLSIQP